MNFVQTIQRAGVIAGYGYRMEWNAYQVEFKDRATMGYDGFSRLVHNETQSAFFRDAGRQAAEEFERQRKFKPEPTPAELMERFSK